MLNRQVTVAVAAMCCGVTPTKLKRLLKKGGKPVGATVAFGDAVEVCTEAGQRVAHAKQEKRMD